MNKYEKQDAGQKPEIYGIKKTKKTGKCVNNGNLESDMWDVGSIDGTSCIKDVYKRQALHRLRLHRSG